MTGNNSEWISDWYIPALDHMSRTDYPKGPPESINNMKISKDVGWYYGSVDEKTDLHLKYGIHKSEVRYQLPIVTRNDGFGFRLAKDKTP